MSELTVNFHSLHYYHSFGLSTPTVYPLVITRASPRTTRSDSLLLAPLIVVVYTSCLFLNLVIFHVCLVLSIRIRYTAQSALFLLLFFFACRCLEFRCLICFDLLFPRCFPPPTALPLPPSPCCAAQRKGLFLFFSFQPTAALFEFVKPLCPALAIFFNPSLFLDLSWNVNHFLVAGRKDKFKCTWKRWKHFFWTMALVCHSDYQSGLFRSRSISHQPLACVVLGV